MKRLLGTLIIAILTVGSLTACGKKDGGTTPAAATSTGPSDSSAFGENTNGGGASNPPSDGSGGGQSPGTDKSAAPTYPGDAKGYCQAAVTAWTKNDSGRIKQLAGTGAVSNFQYIEKGADTNWKYAKKDGSDCILRNDHGDQLQVTIDEHKLGKPQAVTDVVIEKTEYPSDPSSYVNNFINAWYNGNTQRMAIYSSHSIASNYGGKKAPPNWTEGQPKEDKGDYWLVHGSSNAGDSYTFKVKKSLGKANGILGIS
jgi:predicted small lipoprotein YifL